MQQHLAPTAVTELRLRLYRPDPPVDAVEAYLAALAAVVAEQPPVREAHPAPHRRGRAALPTAAALVVLSAAGFALTTSRQASASDVAAAVVTSAPASIAMPPVTGRPIGTLTGPDATTGLFDAKGTRVVVSVLCRGTGTITLTLGPEPPTVLTCEQGGPALAMLASTRPLGRFTIAVRPDRGVRWSLTAGASDLGG
jgi:hypothetical protein